MKFFKKLFYNSKFNNYLKANLIFSFIISLLFLTFNTYESFLVFGLIVCALLSSIAILYLLFYILSLPFLWLQKYLLYLYLPILSIVQLGLFVDFFIYKLYSFHINAMVLNIILSPQATDSIHLGFWPIFLIIFLVIFIISIQILLIKYNPRIWGKKFLFLIFIIILTEKLTYGISSLYSRTDILQKFVVVPLYQPLTFNKIAYKKFGFKPKVKKQKWIIKNIKYPKQPIKLSQITKTPNIFIFVIDAMRASIITPQTAPHISSFAKTAHTFTNNRSGGNATRFGIFSIFYGINPTYWFSFLKAQHFFKHSKN